jgi:hypothetical protein
MTMVEYLINLNDNENEYTPITITQAIMNIHKAWRTVKDLTIVNCWRNS